MDPPLVNEASFTASANPSSYSLAGLLSFPADGGASGMGMRGGVDESTPTELGGAKRGRDVKLKPVSPIVPNQDSNWLNGKRTKVSESRTEVESNSIPLKTVKPEPPRDYIHVRARRGQATDSHSLAERARREKISERMKVLQDLVPGCNKVIGKALVLDEIINYIQSLQHQVEFLSMKLEAVNSTSRMNPTMEDFPLKDLTTQAFDTSALFYGMQTPGEYARGSQIEWLHMHVGSDFNTRGG